jgi:hypothetical protein
MNPFSKKQRFTAVLKKAPFKNVKKKGSSAKDGGRVRMVDMFFDAPFTEGLREVLLPPRKKSNGEDWKDVGLASTVSVYASGDFTSKSDKALHCLGGEAGDGCVCDVQKTFNDDDGPKFQVWIRCARTPSLVNWISDMVGEGECVLEVQCTQQQLPGVEDKAPEEPRRGRGRPKKVKKDATTELPLEPEPSESGGPEPRL